MSRILVIQPHKMLQHAFSVALFPEYQVEVMEMIPDAAAVKNFDLVIVDAAALRQRDSLATRELSDVQNWKTPTIWIDAAAAAQAPTSEALMVIDQPISKDALQKALAECLGRVNAAKQSVNANQVESPSATKGNSAATDVESQVIDLVEIVEEGSAREKSKAPQHKTK
jgi:DNA-binding LytR/AlgR family response regulator